jgi:hypothetical protein
VLEIRFPAKRGLDYSKSQAFIRIRHNAVELRTRIYRIHVAAGISDFAA